MSSVSSLSRVSDCGNLQFVVLKQVAELILQLPEQYVLQNTDTT